MTSDTPLERFLAALPHPARKNGSGWIAHCPAHQDDRSSLSISEGGDGRVLLKCHAGCGAKAITAALHLEMRDLFPPREQAGEPEAVYDYPDESATLLFQVVRFPGKSFRQRRPDGAGGWIWNLQGVRRVLYRLPELKGYQTIAIAEGEKDVESLRRVGVPATCNSGGAGKWRDEYSQQLKAVGVENVAVLPDNDAPGEAHGRMVARSCHDAGLFVKLIALPDLPPKGDVTDFLRTHTKQDLCALIEAAPDFNPAQLVANPPKLEMVSIRDFLAEPEDQTEWLVEDRIPAGGLVLIAGTPKAGKSTLARDLAFAVGTGDSWLGWRAHYGAVWFLGFEDKRSEVRKAFRTMGATGAEPIHLFVDQAPADMLAQLQARAATERPALIIVDTLQRLLKVKDLSDYAEVTQRFDPLLKLARSTGAALVLLHHASTHAQREDVLDSVLGSTAIVGSVDNILLLKRTERYRTLASTQRVGPDLEPLVIARNETTGRLEVVGRKQDADVREATERIVEYLRDQDGPVTEADIRQHVEGRMQYLWQGLRCLWANGHGRLARTGAGKRGNPYRYALQDPSTVSCSLVPLYVQEQGNKKPSTSAETASQYVLPSLVPESSENVGNHATKPQESPDETGSDSCSREPDEDEYERI